MRGSLQDVLGLLGHLPQDLRRRLGLRDHAGHLARQEAAFLSALVVEDGVQPDAEAAKEWLLTDGEDVREYLYGLDSARLASLVGNASIRMAAFPHLFEDDIILPKGGFDTTEYLDVPVMMLTGSTEFSFFNNFAGCFFAPDYTAYDEETQAAGINFGNIYGSDMYRIFNTQMSAEKMFDAYEGPIYLCQVDFGGINSSVAIQVLHLSNLYFESHFLWIIRKVTKVYHQLIALNR